jgi:tripartite-type tricarboxylate transporter receptor subunit TctC
MSLSLMQRTFIGLAGIWGCLLADLQMAASAFAQADYPNKPIRIIVGFTAGGSTDIVARLVAAKMQASFGQPVVVENKPGAGGAIAAEFVAKSAPDGYTILLPPSGHSSSAAMRKSLPYDAVNDFAWISTITTYGMMFAVRPGSPIQTVEDLIKHAKASPNKLSYYSVGVGTGHHLIGEWLNTAAGIEINHVPYRGSAAALPDFMGGQVDVMVDTMTFALTQAQAGKAKPLAVTSKRRLVELPHVPTMSEKVPGFVYESWIGLAGPKGLSPAIVQKINAEIAQIVKMPDIQARLKDIGATPQSSTPEEFRNLVASDIETFTKVIKLRNIPLE